MGTRNCLSCMFGSKSCHIRVAIDTAAEITLFRPTFSSARADTTFDEWTYICTRFIASKSMRFGEYTLSLSRIDTVIYRSGSPHDASHLPSILYVNNTLPLALAVHEIFRHFWEDRFGHFLIGR